MAHPAPSPTRASLPQEVPIAITCNGSTQAVMMASPFDLMDFAVGFCRSEGYLTTLSDIEHHEIVDHGRRGIETRLWLTAERAASLAARRRKMMGPVGCGLCGLDSLTETLRPLPRVAPGFSLPEAEIARATTLLSAAQRRGGRGSGLHATALLRPGGHLSHLREDIGRHNAMDKTLGAHLRAGEAPDAALVTTSRVSLDLVQKCAIAGVPMLIAVSTPSEAAVEAAREAGVVLVGRARGDGFEFYG